MKSIYGLVVALLLGACIGEPNQSSEGDVRVVKSVDVKAYDEQSRVVEYPAKINVATDVNLSFRVAGILDCVVVDEGCFVREGDVVALLDKRDYQLQLEATQAEYDGVKSEVDRIIAMYEEQSVSENDYDKAVVGLRRITAKLKADSNALEDATLRAPFDGYVDKRYFDRGEALAVGMPVVSFVSMSAPELIVNLPAAEYLRRDDLVSASASVKLFPGVEFPLRLISFAPTANLNQLYAARFEVESVDGVLPPAGVTAMVSIGFDVKPSDSFEIPFSAVVERGGQTSVWRIKEGEVSPVKVSVERLLSSGVAIVKGDLECGDEVVAAGVSRLKIGDKVKSM